MRSNNGSLAQKSRRICVVTTSRADYWLLRWLMEEIRDDGDLELQVVVTGMHLSPEFGLTCRAIEEDGFEVAAHRGEGAVLMNVIDPSVISYGRVLQSAKTGFGVSIEAGCNGVEAMIILASAMLAFPAPWKHRLAGVAIGFAAIQALLSD